MKSIYSKKAKKIIYFLAFLKVGATGFEPATTCSQNRSATGLRYTPLIELILIVLSLISELRVQRYYYYLIPPNFSTSFFTFISFFVFLPTLKRSKPNP